MAVSASFLNSPLALSYPSLGLSYIEFIPIVSQLPGYPGLLAVSNLYLLYYYKGKGAYFLASNIRGGAKGSLSSSYITSKYHSAKFYTL